VIECIHSGVSEAVTGWSPLASHRFNSTVGKYICKTERTLIAVHTVVPTLHPDTVKEVLIVTYLIVLFARTHCSWCVFN
jgi:hypothetical protein